MLKAALSALLLAASPLLPPNPSAPGPTVLRGPAAPAAPDESAPDMANLKGLADALAEGPVSESEGQPMHVKALMPGRHSEGQACLILFSSVDSKLETALLVLWKDGHWTPLDVFKA